MFRVSDLIDLPIIAVSPNIIENFSVKSILLDGLNNRIFALICKENVIKKHCRVIPYEKIISIDINKIVVLNNESIQKVPSKEFNNFIQLESVLNKLVKSDTGDLLGLLTDIYVNLLTGKIIAYELSEGYIDDILKGRKVMNIEETLKNIVKNEEIVVYQRLN